MRHRLVTLEHGQAGYADLLGQVRADEELAHRMWVDAESRPGELDRPGTRWCVALVRDGGRWVPAAWAAAIEATESGRRVLKCHSNFERPAYRGRGLYASAYAHRHATVVVPSVLPAVTYLFPEPVALHEADGWYKAGPHGAGELEGHWWWELRRDPRSALV